MSSVSNVEKHTESKGKEILGDIRFVAIYNSRRKIFFSIEETKIEREREREYGSDRPESRIAIEVSRAKLRPETMTGVREKKLRVDRQVYLRVCDATKEIRRD